jgi:hypothetical protein
MQRDARRHFGKTSPNTLTHLCICDTLYEYLNNDEKYVLIEAASCQEYERKGADAEVLEALGLC